MFETNHFDKSFYKIEPYFENFFENTIDVTRFDVKIRFEDIFTKKGIK